MNRAEVFLGTPLESRYRLETVVREAPDLLVFQGRDLESGATVDVRMARALRGMSIEELLDAVDAFNAEAALLRRLSNASSHVEQLLASGKIDGPDHEHLAYCVFARVEGVPLSQARPRGSPPLPLARAVAMLEPIAAALATAHDLGVFHGDVRPENMLVIDDVERPTMKLVGFTRATRLGNAAAARAFSAEYGAPEHHKKAQGETGVGPATDTYALALALIELVTGQPPLLGSSASELYKETMDIAKRPTLRARGVAVSPEIDAIIERAVAVNPKLRWPSVREFWSALTTAVAISAPEPVSSSKTSPVDTSAPSLRPLDEGLEDTRPPAARSSGGSTRAAVAGVVIVIVAVGIAIGVGLRRTPSGAAPPPIDAPAPPAPVAPASTPPLSSGVAPAPARAAPEGMVRVPAGAFTMGKDDGKIERPAHRVVLTHAFYIDRTEVTIDRYNACVDEGACTPRIVHLRKNVSGAWGCNLDREHGAYPANCVDRRQAIAYCGFVKKRLPTEAEWEYAARGGDGREYPWGNAAPRTCTLAVLSGMTGACGDRHGASPVGSAPDGASAFGLLDMGGNVWEWVADDYAAYPSNEVTDPLATDAADAPLRGVLRGGAWDYGPESARATYRLPFIAEAGNASIGIRCALTD
ncbi:MAG: SUMF1/EgtB/PvdO family nonheme iron enzyme [Labilithrix sp.]